jgi:hypothetical protein
VDHGRRIEQWPGGSTARNHASFRVSTLAVPIRDQDTALARDPWR